VIGKLRAFGAFWYDFIVGDDWQVAAGVVAALALTFGLSRAGAPAWWILRRLSPSYCPTASSGRPGTNDVPSMPTPGPADRAEEPRSGSLRMVGDYAELPAHHWPVRLGS
jgi:hypothetical protein